MMEQDFEYLDPVQLARELNRCRQHGLDDLDLNLHKKPAVPKEEIAHLADLARAYRGAIGVTATTREAAIRRLLVDGLAAYAEQDTSDSAFVQRFFFDASGTVPKKGPTELQKDLTEELHVSDKRLAERRTAAFIRFATFLITFVSKLSHVVPAVWVREVVVPSSPTTGRRISALAQRARVAGLLIVGITVVLLLASTSTALYRDVTVPSASATTVSGYVECWPDTTKEVEGVWIAAASGGSGWATWHALPGQPNIAWFSRTLPRGGEYFVHVGCGGTTMRWELPLNSVTALLGSGYYFTCYDTFVADNPSSGQCRP